PRHGSPGRFPRFVTTRSGPGTYTGANMSDAASRGVRIADLLKSMVARGASDIHLQAGAPPHMRVDGELQPYEGVPPLTPEQTEQIALAMMSESQRDLFRHRHEIDFA